MKSLLIFITILTATHCFTLRAQQPAVKLNLADGIFIAGYVDQGAYLNFTGPNVSLTHKSSKFIVGMLPSLRFKEDHGATRNAFVTPTLGVGFTYSYKAFAVQLPLYYNAKTATSNGKWNIGIGVGMRLNALRKKDK